MSSARTQPSAQAIFLMDVAFMPDTWTHHLKMATLKGRAPLRIMHSQSTNEFRLTAVSNTSFTFHKDYEGEELL